MLFVRAHYSVNAVGLTNEHFFFADGDLALDITCDIADGTYVPCGVPLLWLVCMYVTCMLHTSISIPLAAHSKHDLESGGIPLGTTWMAAPR